MGKLTVVVLAALATPAYAQQAQWVRIQLNDGRFVDGQITGGDAQNHFVQTQQGYFSILRANVVSITPMQTANVAPAPMPMASDDDTPSRFTYGLRIAVGTYLLTAIIAGSRTKDDDDARYGFIPIAGPLLWTLKNDEDDAFEDGWDWIAMTSTVCQVGGLFGLFTPKKSRTHWLLSANGGRNYGGLSVAGNW